MPRPRSLNPLCSLTAWWTGPGASRAIHSAAEVPAGREGRPRASQSGARGTGRWRTRQRVSQRQPASPSCVTAAPALSPGSGPRGAVRLLVDAGPDPPGRRADSGFLDEQVTTGGMGSPAGRPRQGHWARGLPVTGMADGLGRVQLSPGPRQPPAESGGGLRDPTARRVLWFCPEQFPGSTWRN